MSTERRRSGGEPRPRWRRTPSWLLLALRDGPGALGSRESASILHKLTADTCAHCGCGQLTPQHLNPPSTYVQVGVLSFIGTVAVSFSPSLCLPSTSVTSYKSISGVVGAAAGSLHLSSYTTPVKPAQLFFLFNQSQSTPPPRSVPRVCGTALDCLPGDRREASVVQFGFCFCPPPQKNAHVPRSDARSECWATQTSVSSISTPLWSHKRPPK